MTYRCKSLTAVLQTSNAAKQSQVINVTLMWDYFLEWELINNVCLGYVGQLLGGWLAICE